jgi:hypothetical protein
MSVIVGRLREIGRYPAIATATAVLSGAGVFALATTVFAYHSTNHDEAVYLMQAAMLLEGQLELHVTGATGAFRPWFFIEDGHRLYPKYTPVPAAMYAVSMALFEEPRVTLAAIAAGNTALMYVLGTTVFDRRIGIVAATLFAASPLAIVTTSVFLPYAPTTFLNLLFAVAYLRTLRTKSLATACVAGIAIGLAFFARPYTAVLFAAPFVVHALYRVTTSIRDGGLLPPADPVRQHGATALFGLLFVGVTLAYNLQMTGSPLLFPYEAFAPLDGPGFGRRQILGHSIVYTPEVALRANGYTLWYLATRWFTAGPIGTTLTAGGLALAVRHWIHGENTVKSKAGKCRSPPSERTAGILLAGLFVTVPVGNVLFWGNYNILATLTDPTDGLISQFGPFYHFDLLAPLSVFAALALVSGWRFIAGRAHIQDRLSDRATAVFLVCLLTAVLVVGGIVNVAVLSGPIERNAAHTDKYESAYEPVESEPFDNALVFVPTPYGGWQHHPFQALRNDPGLDGSVVYALDRGPDGDFAVLDAYPDRTYYRYAYQGEWTPSANRHVVPKLEPLTVRSGTTLYGETAVGVPDRVERATVRLEIDGGKHVEYAVDEIDDEIEVGWSLSHDSAQLGHLEPGGAVPINETERVILLITLVQPDGSTLTYRQESTVRADSDGVEVVWPPERYVCPLVTDCGNEGTYLPDDPTAHRSGVSFETRIDKTVAHTLDGRFSRAQTG